MDSMKDFDVIVIGAGAVGNAIARELSKYKLKVAVLEKELDTGFETSGRNSGVLHAGFNNRPETLMAKLCVEGSCGFAAEAELLDIQFKRTGKLVTAETEEERAELERLKAQGEANGADGFEIIDGEAIRRIHPHIGGNWALWSRNTGVFDPFEYTAALCEHACQNGVSYFFGAAVEGIRKCGAGVGKAGEASSRELEFEVGTDKEVFRCRWLINSAGLYADEVCRMVGIDKYEIRPCRGEYHILDKACAPDLTLPVYPVPNPKAGGLGIHLTPSVHGNIMIGPSAEYLGEGDRDEYDSTKSVMDMLFQGGHELLSDIKRGDIIRSFSGIRPKLTTKETGGYADFVIRQEPEAGRYISLVGIESPGLTASIPIGRMVVNMILEQEDVVQNPEYEPRRRKQKAGRNADAADAVAAMSRRILCRCEKVAEQQILQAFDDIVEIGATPTLRGIKNRTRAGMGRCQGGFCAVKIVELLEKNRDVDPLKFCWDKTSGRMFTGHAR